MKDKQANQSVTLEQYKPYAAAFAYFNKRLFGNKLPQAMLVFSRAKNPKTEAFTVHAKWHKDGEKVSEISISPEAFDGKTPDQIFRLLVREMCKHWQMTEGFSTAPSGRITEGKAMTYVNEALANQFKLVGLNPFRVDSKTGERIADKETGQGVDVDIIANGAFARAVKEMPESIRLPWSARPDFKREKKESDKKTVGRVKYTAGDGENVVNVWAKPGLTIKVQIGKRLVIATEDGNTETEKAA